MNHVDHVDLLRDGIPSAGGTWADFGAGAGAFTLALAELLGAGGRIIAVDRDTGALDTLKKSFETQFPETRLEVVEGDFSRPLGLPLLEGIVMANSLHYFQDKAQVLARVRNSLVSSGRLIVVEYDTDQGNQWVPYPVSYARWERLALRAGFQRTQRLATKPSRFLGRFYSALSK